MNADAAPVDESWLDGRIDDVLPPARPLPAASLPMAGEIAERRDALRNRTRVLDAARLLLSEDGADGVDIRDVARAAGVGVGTVYRRFGDKAGLCAALLDDRERSFQEALLNGPPPLGPGAPPRERLVAFLHALDDLIDENLALLRTLQGTQPGKRFHVGAYRAWRLHATVLLRDGAPQVDAAWFADLLLAPLAPDLYHHQRYELGGSQEQLRRNIEHAVDAVLAAPAAG